MAARFHLTTLHYLILAAVAIGLLVGAWQWSQRGIIGEVVDPQAQATYEATGLSPTLTIERGFGRLTCPIDHLVPLDEETCAIRVLPTKTEFSGPVLDDAILALFVAVGTYFVLAGALLTARAVQRSA